MTERRYPNESQEYREARDALLKDEQALVDMKKALAAKRRALPLGGELKEDYTFQWAQKNQNDGKVGENVKFSALFGDKPTLLIYSVMFGPGWDKPCPSCTSLMDGFDRSAYQVTRDAAFVGLAKAQPERINAWAKERGWVADRSSLGPRLAIPERLQVPGAGQRRHAMAGAARLPQARWKKRRQDLTVLGDGVAAQSCRHGVAVLESDGLHARGPAGPGDAAAEIQERVFGRELFEEEVATLVIAGLGVQQRAFLQSTRPLDILRAQHPWSKFSCAALEEPCAHPGHRSFPETKVPRLLRLRHLGRNSLSPHSCEW